MTSREAFEKWMRAKHPSASLESGFNGEVHFYHDVNSQIRWEAWREAKRISTTEPGRFVKKPRVDNPETIVKRLNGIWGNQLEPYPMTELHYEAAREIERLREELCKT